MRYRLRTLLIVLGIAPLVLAGLYLLSIRTAQSYRTEIGRGVTAEQANRVLRTCKVPTSAKDVWFTSSRESTHVECDIDEATFVNWAKELGADPLPLNDSPVKYRPMSERDETLVWPKRGYEILTYTLSFQTHIVGVYDADKGRAYILDKGER